MYKVFNDSQLQTQFEQDGFAKIQLLDKQTIKELEEFYTSAIGSDIKNSMYGMFVSLDAEDMDFKLSVMSMVQQKIIPKLEEQLNNINCHLGSYLIKSPDDFSYTPPHQDWTFIDYNDSEAFSATVWISLYDLSIKNGTLGLIKGSHRFLNNVVGSPSPAIHTATMGHEATFVEYLHFPEVKAGDALIFNNKLVHAALPNLGNFNRVAVGIGITPKQSKLYHYFLKPGTNDKLLKLATTDQFYLNYGNDKLYNSYIEGRVPEFCEVVEEINYQPILKSDDELKADMIAHGNVESGVKFDMQQFVKREQKDNVVIESNQFSFSAEELELLKESIKEELKEEMWPIMNDMIGQWIKGLNYDNRSFFQTYTPLNILKELKKKLIS